MSRTSRTGRRWVAAVAAASLVVAGGIALTPSASGAPGLETKKKPSPRSYQYGNWSTVGAGFSGNNSNIVYRLMRMSDDTLIAAGTFRKSGDDTVNRMAKFAGSAWGNLAADDSGISPGVPTTLNANGDWPGVFGAKINGDDSVYIAGTFQFADDDTVNNVARWVGTGWKRMGKGLKFASNSEPLQDIVIGHDPSAAFDTNYADDTIFAVGGITGICTDINSCATGGSSPYVGVTQWRDDTWTSVSPATFNNMIITGAYWDDTTATDDTLFVAGKFTRIIGTADDSFNNIAAWSYADDTWHNLGYGLNNEIYAATVHPTSGDLYVAGKFTKACGDRACTSGAQIEISDGVAKWDRGDKQWYSVGSGMTNPNFDDIGFSPNGQVMFIAGFGGTADGTNLNGIAQLSGGDFSTGATNVGGSWLYLKSSGVIGVSPVAARSVVVKNDGSVYVAGNFTSAGAVSALGVALFTPGPEPSPYDPVYPPGVPTDVVATSGWNKVVVDWKAPTYTGSYPITNYLVTSSPGNRVCITTLQDAKLTQCTFTSLTPGTKYTFTVQGLNGGGWGDRSAASNVASPQNLKITSYSRKKLNFFQGSGSEVSASGIAPGFAQGTKVIPWVKIGEKEWESAPTSNLAVDSIGRFSWKRKFSKKQNSTPMMVRFEIGGNFSNTVKIPGVK